MCFLFRYKARNNSGQIGLVPRNYLQELTEYLAQPFRGSAPGSGSDPADRRNDTMPPPPAPMQNNGGGNMPPPERPNLAGKSWYYGAITRNQCDTVLNQHGHDGDYLIRDSETNVSFQIIFFFIYYWEIDKNQFFFADGRLFCQS